MPTAMRRCWDGRGRRRGLAEALNDFDARRMAAQEARAKRRRDLMEQIASYLPWELIPLANEYSDLFDRPDTPADDTPGDCPNSAESAQQNATVPQTEATTNTHTPIENTAPPPRPYSNPIDARPLPDPDSPNDLPPGPDAKPPE
jgi:hypothetical protein